MTKVPSFDSYYTHFKPSLKLEDRDDTIITVALQPGGTIQKSSLLFVGKERRGREGEEREKEERC
jgi:hypothetical protein